MGTMGWLISLAITAAALAAAVAYMTSMPGRPHPPAPPPLAPQERDVSARLRRHVAELARSDRNLQRPEALERAARYMARVTVGLSAMARTLLVIGPPPARG